MNITTTRKKIISEANTQVYSGAHNSLSGRDAANAHPIVAITGLSVALDGKEPTIGFTPENVANKENLIIDNSTVKYPTVNLLKTGLDGKEPSFTKNTAFNKDFGTGPDQAAEGDKYVPKTGGSFNASIGVGTDDYFYWGGFDVDGSWRQGRDGNNFITQRREAGVWVTKQTLTP